MPNIYVSLEIPEYIWKGIQSGQYVRDAAGVVRYAGGNPSAGQIVAHLKELGSSTVPFSGNILLSVGALAAINLAGFLFLNSKLTQISGKLDQLAADVSDLKRKVGEIYDNQCISLFYPMYGAIEYLYEARVDCSMVGEARKKFIEARGQLGGFLEAKNAVSLIENLGVTDRVLNGLAMSFAGEYSCLHMMQVDGPAVDSVITRYKMSLGSAKSKLESFRCKGIVPDLKELEAMKNLKSSKTSVERIENTLRYLDSESLFSKALQSVPREQIQSVGVELGNLRQFGKAIIVVDDLN